MKDILEQNVSTLIEQARPAEAGRNQGSDDQPPEMSPDARARIKAELVGKFAVETAPRAARPLLAIGIGVAALAAAALLLVHGTSTRGSSTPALATTTLADGTTYVADRGAHVDAIGPRHVRVTGAVLFDVVPGKGRFVVETARGTVEVLGTKFVVDGEPDATSAAVIRGEVKLASAAGDVTLHAGEQGVAQPGKPPVRGPAPRLSHLVSWAREARRADATPVHHGTLFARDPGVRSHPPWGDEYPLPLAQLGIDVVVEDQVARVALDQTFHNTQAQDLEGVYRFAIPADAALQRLAMYVNGQLEESAVVERMAARRIYEQLVYRRVDPALLEWAGTGRLSLRVYPIPANSDKRLVLAYTQSLPKLYDDYALTIPLPEVDEPVGSLDATVRVKGCANCEIASPSHTISVERTGDDAVVHYHEAGGKLGDSFVLHVRDPRHAPVVTAKTDGSDRYLMVRSPIELSHAATPYRPRTWLILDDVSASRGRLELHAQRDLIDALVHELDENDRVAVVAFDVAARVMLPPTRTLDVDRRALRGKLDGEGGIGATDFQVALDAAMQQLAGVSPDDAMIVYVGDGMITAGPRNLDALRAQIAGKAHFVGVGVGDGPDTQTLGALAAATGGYATTLDLADDLGWRAFDLVAALHTARVTDVSARLVDAAGRAVPATAYLAAPQLADGEELELVAKLAGAGTPAALELDGTQAGAPWHQRIALTSAREAAGYLPRLWAQRHIAARLLAKHEPVVVPPCSSDKCPLEADLRELRDEQIRREVVELGKRYFLLSRHTSLLVLENDAMYAQYGVTKGAGDTWAPYALPQHIAVAHLTPPPPQVQADAELIRWPEQVALQDQETARISRMEWMEERDNPLGPFEKNAAFAQPTPTTPPIATLLPAGSTESDGPAMELDEGKMGKRDADMTVARIGWAGDDLDRRGVAIGGEGGGFGTGHSGRAFGNKHFPYWGIGARGLDGDLTAFVPALFHDDVDSLRELHGSGKLDPAAQQLLAQARAAVQPGVYRWGDRELAIDRNHALAWRRTTDDDVVEVAAYDGALWTRRYPELGLSVTRAMPDSDAAIALVAAPLWIADPAHYAALFDVSASGRDVVLRAADRVAFVLSFDAQARLVAVRDGAGRELVSITWSATGPTAARVGGEPVAVAFSAKPIDDATAWAFAGTQPGVVAALPAHADDYSQRRMAIAAVGSVAWRDAARQLLVSAAASHAVDVARMTFDELRAHGGVELGDVVLASGGLTALVSRGELDAELGALAHEPIGRALGAVKTAAAPANVAAPGVFGAFLEARAALDAVRANKLDATTAAFAALGGRALGLRVAVANSTLYSGATPAIVQAAWEGCATGAYANLAREAEVLQLESLGAYAAAADVFARAVDRLDLSAPAPATLANAEWVFAQAGRGVAGWQLVYARWRDRVVTGDSLSHVMALVPAASTRNDLDPVLAKAVALAAGDPELTLDVARAALQYNQAAWADRIVAPLVASAPTRERYQLAAQIALRLGRSADALADLEHAQDASGNEPAPIGEVRAELAQIIALAKQLALQTTGPARDQLVARAMHWGERWRAVDPGSDVDIDRALGELLVAVGDRAGAWRQLSTAIEHDPWSSTGYALVAETYEQQGQVDDALAFWQQAIVIDQTNPTPRLRKAQALFALGHKGEAEALLRQITDQKWHDVWSGVVEQARELRRR